MGIIWIIVMFNWAHTVQLQFTSIGTIKLDCGQPSLRIIYTPDLKIWFMMKIFSSQKVFKSWKGFCVIMAGDQKFQLTSITEWVLMEASNVYFTLTAKFALSLLDWDNSI